MRVYVCVAVCLPALTVRLFLHVRIWVRVCANELRLYFMNRAFRSETNAASDVKWLRRFGVLWKYVEMTKAFSCRYRTCTLARAHTQTNFKIQNYNDISLYFTAEIYRPNREEKKNQHKDNVNDEPSKWKLNEKEPFNRSLSLSLLFLFVLLFLYLSLISFPPAMKMNEITTRRKERAIRTNRKQCIAFLVPEMFD